MEVKKYADADGVPHYRAVLASDVIEELLRRTPEGSISVLYGQNIGEVFTEFAERSGKRFYVRYVLADRNIDLSEHYLVNSRLLYKRKDRVLTFISRGAEAFHSVAEDGAQGRLVDPLRFALTADAFEFKEQVREKYVKSKRVRNGAEEEFDEFWNTTRSFRGWNELVVFSGRLSYEALIVLWLAVHDQRGVKIVIVQGGAPLAEDGERYRIVRERSYIDAAELLRLASPVVGLTEVALKKLYGYWQKSNKYEAQRIENRGGLTSEDADSFLELCRFRGADVDDGAHAEVPAQVAAPLRFRPSAGYLDILADRQLAPDEPRVVGAAHTCLNALDDLCSYTGFSNVIPTFVAKTARIRKILEEIKIGNYDDNVVVQLGTESRSLFYRIKSAEAQLGELSIAEGATFIVVVEGFLSQFDIWSSYQARVRAQEQPATDAQVALARDILLRVQVSVESATQNTRERVEGYISGLEMGEISIEAQEGAISSAGNVVSQAASQALVFAKEQGIEFAKDITKEVKKETASGLVKFFIKNFPQMAKFARETGMSWFDAFTG